MVPEASTVMAAVPDTTLTPRKDLSNSIGGGRIRRQTHGGGALKVAKEHRPQMAYIRVHP